jgi:hypothetical protein
MASKKKMRRKMQEMQERMASLEDAQAARELDEALPPPSQPVFEINLFVIQETTFRAFNLPGRQANAAAARETNEAADEDAADRHARAADGVDTRAAAAA